MTTRRLRAAAALAVGFVLAPAAVAAQPLLEPSPYLRASDSPFAVVGTFAYFHRETFEDYLFNVPGVVATAGGAACGASGSGCGVTSLVFGPSFHDSVDEDDGVVDGSGLRGDSFFAPNGPGGITFAFDLAALGGLPTHAGLVWTDGLNPIVFEAYDQDGRLLGSLAGNHADASVNGETAEDRFYGAVNPGGISRIVIRSGLGGGGIEVDHLQYGRVVAAVVPEPSAVALVGAGLAGLHAVARRRQRRRAA